MERCHDLAAWLLLLLVLWRVAWGMSVGRLEAFLLGVSTYAVFEFTCLSMFEDYSPAFALADTAWGGVLTLAVFSILHWKPVEKLLL